MSDTVNDAKEIIGQFFNNLGDAGDTEGLISLLADDVTVYTPFAPKGQPVNFSGIEEIKTRFGDAREAMQSFGFLDIEILATEDPERWLATCHSKGVNSDGRDYANIYCWIFRVRNNKIVWWCEYYDPQQVMPFLENMDMSNKG